MKDKLQALKKDPSYAILFMDNPAIMMILDSETGDILAANEAAISFYGYSLQEMMKMNIGDINIYSQEDLLEEMALAKEEKRNSFNFTHMKKDQSFVPVHVMSYPVNYSGHVFIYSVITKRFEPISSDKSIFEMLDKSMDSFCVIEEKAKEQTEIIYSNHVFKEMTNMSYDTENPTLLSQIIREFDGKVFKMTSSKGGSHIVQLIKGDLYAKLTCIKFRYQGRILTLLQLKVIEYRLISAITLETEFIRKAKQAFNEKAGYFIGVEYYTSSHDLQVNKNFSDFIELKLKSILGKYDIEYILISRQCSYVYTTCDASMLNRALNEFISLLDNDIEHQLYKKDYRFRIGISEKYPIGNKSITSLEKALNSISENNYNIFAFATYSEEIQQSNAIREDIQIALDEDQFVLYCQPIVDINKQILEGVEVLIRWEHPSYGMIYPDQFIHIAEITGEIKAIDEWVLKNSLDYIEKNKHALKNLKIHINLSSKSLENKTIYDLLLMYHPLGTLENVVLEITEESDSEILTETFINIKNLGMAFAIDDFGTGFSSFERLKKTDVYYVKIDKSLVDHLDTNLEDILILKAIISMCQSLDINIIVEGVETPEQIEFFSAHKCYFIQGYYFSKPFNMDQLITIASEFDKSVERKLAYLESKNIFSRHFYNRGHVYLLLVDFDYQIVHPNIGLARALGYSNEDIRNLKLQEIIAHRDWDYFSSAIESLENSDEIVSFTTSVVGKDGKYNRVICALKNVEGIINAYIEFTEKYSEMESNLLGLSQSYIETFHRAPVGIMILEDDYKIDKWNNASKEILAFRQSEENINIFEIFKNSVKKLSQLLNKAKECGVSEDIIELTVNHSQNRVVSLIVNSIEAKHSFKEKYICIIQDITEKIKIEKEQSKINTALNQSKSVIMMTNTSGEIDYVNEAFEEVTGYGIDEVSGQHTRILSSREQSDAYYSNLWQTITSGQVWHGDFHNKRKDGSYYWCKSSIFPIMFDGQISGYLSIQQDISHEKELIDRNEILKTKLFEQDKVASLGMLTSGIMHEINNPLAYIESNISFLNNIIMNIEEASKEDLVDLKETFMDIGEGIDQIKRISSGLKKYVFKHDPNSAVTFDLVQALNETLIISKNEYKYHAKIIANYDENEAYTISGDPSKFKQVLLNLIINASHAIASKDNETLGLISISFKLIEHYISVEFRDNGIGIKDDFLLQIFEPFYTTKEFGIGSGLGLSVSKQIIEDDFDGQIKCMSQYGKGTTFEIILPRGNV